MLRHRADTGPDDVFLVFQGSDARVEITYADMADRAQSTAAALSALGVTAGERVVAAVTNSVEFFEIWFGTVELGAVFVPVNPLNAADEICWILTDTRAMLAIGNDDTVETLRAGAQSAGGDVSVVRVDDVAAHARAIGNSGAATYPAASSKIAPTDAAAILYTSGTTSRPKGVVVTHANYLHAGTEVARHLDLGSDDRWLVVLPLFHANAQYYCTMSAMVAGASIAVGHRFSASNWARWAHELRPTLASLFAAPVRMILRAPRTDDDGRNGLRATLFAQHLDADDVADFESTFDCPLIQLYGMTETIAPATFNQLGPDRRADRIGPALGGRVLRVVDAAGNDVADGEVGELLVGGLPGQSLMAGYLNNPDATASAMADGWLHTGDLVAVDADGSYRFVDRAKDMIKRSGENIAASEIERVVDAHPAVAESAAVGVADPVYDEAIVVHAVLAPGAQASPDDIISWCAQRLARFKVPDAVVLCTELPRTSVGKVRKADLRQPSQFDSTTTTFTASTQSQGVLS
ncbi:class I adenylate-forming enzyme family protein [Gordonia asplenii]|uniref:class I adenylate-forming enzyme family protein n=1 Tax=Gordonia asplenii TaxID=2725283 RepID=UPI001B7D6F08|nr:AMP-binding protein [Gordonia asplenii]